MFFRNVLLADKHDFADRHAFGEIRIAHAELPDNDRHDKVTSPTMVVCGGMLGCRVGQRVAGASKLAAGVAPGWRTAANTVLLAPSNAAPPIAAPTGAR